jgi:hypothetical protein
MNVTCKTAFGILFCLILCPGFSLDIPISYEKIPEPQDMVFRPQGNGYFKKLLDPPDGLCKMPKFIHKVPVYAFLKLGETQRMIILDFQNSTDQFYSRLYFDANNNKDLTDDPVFQTIRINVQSNYYNSSFPLIETSYEMKGTILPYRFNISVNFFTQNPQSQGDALTKENIRNTLNIYYQVKCYYNGSFQLDGETYNFAINDNNGNGSFSDSVSLPEYTFKNQTMRYPIYPQGDRIYLKYNGKPSWDDDQILTTKIILKNKLYDLAIDETKSLMTLVPALETSYSVNLPMDIDRITFYRKDGKSSVGVYNSTRPLNVPMGEYIFLAYTVFRKDRKGGQWFLKAGATKDTPWFTVDGEGIPEVVLGEPYTPLVDIPEWSKQQFQQLSSSIQQVQLSFNVEGKGKELISSLNNLSGNLSDIPMSGRYTNRPKEPTYTITKMNGVIVAQGAFEYG